MKNRDLFKKLNKEFDEVVPPMSQRVKEQPIKVAKQAKTAQTVAPEKTQRNGRFSFTFRAVAVACSLLIVFVALAVIIPNVGYRQNDTFVSMKINPEFSLVADSKGKVVNVAAVNRDAEVVIYALKEEGQTIEGTDIEEALGRLATVSYRLGYRADGQISISAVSVRGDEATDEICRSAKAEVETSLADIAQVTVDAVRESVEELKQRVQTFADDVQDDLQSLVSAMARRTDYFGELAKQFVQSGFERAKISLAYTADLLESYIDTLEIRQQAMFRLEEINDAISQRNLSYWQGILFTIVYDGWDLAQYLSYGNEADEQTEALYAEFNAQLQFMEKAGLVATETQYISDRLLYSAVDFQSLREAMDKIERFVWDIADTLSSELQSLIDLTVSTLLTGFSDEWSALSQSAEQVTNADSYVSSMSQLVVKEYQLRKSLYSN